ncbi:MAG: LytTR family DNA-binding domain-containing protein [Candidatus Acidiferrales bacterium]
MRVMVVDDEPLGRSALVNELRERRDIDDVAIANDAVEALDQLQRKECDLLLLDVHMPEMSGIELVDQLKKLGRPSPAIIFVTAHHEHAVAAFEKHAVDYVLKPFSAERVHEALDVAIRRTTAERAASLMQLLPELRTIIAKPAKMAIKVEGRILFVDPAEIVAVEAQGNYVLLQRTSGSYLLRGPISVLAEKLKPYGFVRIHRSVLVNGACVQEIHPWSTGEYLLRTKSGKEYTVSRTYKANLKSIAQLWVGNDSMMME